ncbi:MAG: ATP-binding protein, partial [Treponema sp.]|nr:ATP-binding protein [Treponema sp.]
ISIISDDLGQNAGKLLVKFKDEVVNIIEKIHKGFSKENLQTRVGVYQERMSERKDKNITPSKTPADEYDYENKSKQFIPEEPLYSFDRVILSEETRNKIEESLAIVLYEQKVFEEWGLYEIQPNPSSCLSFYGPSGTGKTMAAEAVAQKLGKKILKVSYADVESKYHGEGPKMVKAIFLAAQNNDAILFFDEADSLLSKRLTNVTQGSEQAINSMRSQILICLEQFHGIVIFATNLVINYDKAFLTRLISVEFKLPDVEQRKLIWNVHIKPLDDGKSHKLNIPLSNDVNINELAEKYEFVGREIRNAVVKACIKAAMNCKNVVEQTDFIDACNDIAEEKSKLNSAKDYTNNINSELPDSIKEKIKQNLKSKIIESESVKQIEEPR